MGRRAYRHRFAKRTGCLRRHDQVIAVSSAVRVIVGNSSGKIVCLPDGDAEGTSTGSGLEPYLPHSFPMVPPPRCGRSAATVTSSTRRTPTSAGGSGDRRDARHAGGARRILRARSKRVVEEQRQPRLQAVFSRLSALSAKHASKGARISASRLNNAMRRKPCGEFRGADRLRGKGERIERRRERLPDRCCDREIPAARGVATLQAGAGRRPIRVPCAVARAEARYRSAEPAGTSG